MQIELYDLQGRLVRTRTKEWLGKPQHIEFAFGNLHDAGQNGRWKGVFRQNRKEIIGTKSKIVFLQNVDCQ